MNIPNVHVRPVDDAMLSRVRHYRLKRIRNEMRRRDIAALVLVDPVNVRYATDTRNMQVFSARNPARYAFIALNGPVVMFEFAGCDHLSSTSDVVDEVRIATTASYVSAASRLDERTMTWVREIADLLVQHGSPGCRVGIERFNAAAAYGLREAGFDVVDAQIPVERARCIKSRDELNLMQISMNVTMEGVAKLRDAVEPGISENRLWSILWGHVIANGGDYIETRLLSSGHRTNPWFQECSDKVIGKGEIISLDTDVVGCYGYYADMSRSFTCGDRATARQKKLYRMAWDQIHYNLDLLRPGVTFKALSQNGWVIPGQYRKHRYYLLAHGIGMTGEYPYILYRDDYAAGGYDGEVKPGMVLCFESFIGATRGGEGIKLEQQVRVHRNGWELMSPFPFEENLLGREF